MAEETVRIDEPEPGPDTAVLDVKPETFESIPMQMPMNNMGLGLPLPPQPPPPYIPFSNGMMPQGMMMAPQNIIPPAAAGLPGESAPLPPPPVEKMEKIDRGPSKPPIRTLYVNNLSCKIPIKRLRTDLRGIFSQYGRVAKLHLMKSFWRRGQAYVVYRTQEEATEAYNDGHGIVYAGRQLRVNYAAEESSLIQNMEGKYVPKERDGPMKPKQIRAREDSMRENQLNGDMPETEKEPRTGYEAAAKKGLGASSYFFSQLAATKEKQQQ